MFLGSIATIAYVTTYLSVELNHQNGGRREYSIFYALLSGTAFAELHCMGQRPPVCQSFTQEDK